MDWKWQEGFMTLVFCDKNKLLQKDEGVFTYANLEEAIIYCYANISVFDNPSKGDTVLISGRLYKIFSMVSDYTKHKVYAIAEEVLDREFARTKTTADYERGYNQALEDINSPMAVVAKRWSPSACPRCEHDFVDYEDCDDGYYHRATSLYRCPYCGQKLDWDVVDR